MMRHDQLLGVFLRLHEDDVDFGEEETSELDECAERERECQGNYTDGVARRGQVERYKRQPENHRCVIGEGDVARLVESFWAFARFYCVYCAYH